jgi:hypothetical protein
MHFANAKHEKGKWFYADALKSCNGSLLKGVGGLKVSGKG